MTGSKGYFCALVFKIKPNLFIYSFTWTFSNLCFVPTPGLDAHVMGRHLDSFKPLIRWPRSLLSARLVYGILTAFLELDSAGLFWLTALYLSDLGDQRFISCSYWTSAAKAGSTVDLLQAPSSFWDPGWTGAFIRWMPCLRPGRNCYSHRGF